MKKMKQMVTALSRAEEVFVKIEEFIAAFTLIFVTILTSYFAIGRKFFAKPPTGLDELARYLIPVIVMFGASVAIRKKSHITAGGLELFTKNKKVIRTAGICIDLLLVVITFLLTVTSWKRYVAVLAVPQKTSTLFIPFKYLELPVTAGITIWFLQYVLQLFRDLFLKEEDTV